MDNQTSSKSAQAEAEEISRSWLDAVELFLKTEVGSALLNEFEHDMQNAVRAILAAQIQVPANASPELAKAVKDLRFDKRRKAKIQLHAVLFFYDRDDDLEREWIALEARARGNVSSIKRSTVGSLPGSKAASPTTQRSEDPLTLPVPPPQQISESVGTLTIPVKYNTQTLKNWKDDGVVPSLKDLFNAEPMDAVLAEEPITETRQAIHPPPSDQEDAPQIEIEEDRGEETPTSELDMIFEDLLDDT